MAGIYGEGAYRRNNKWQKGQVVSIMFGLNKKDRETIAFLSNRISALEGQESNLRARVYALEEEERRKHIVKSFDSSIDFGGHGPNRHKLILEELDTGILAIEVYGVRLELDKVSVDKLKEFLSDNYNVESED